MKKVVDKSWIPVYNDTQKSKSALRTKVPKALFFVSKKQKENEDYGKEDPGVIRKYGIQ